MAKAKNDWLKTKRYMHLDLPLEGRRLGWIVAYVKNRKAIARHSFLPLMRRTLTAWPYRKNDEGVKVCKAKKRRLTYASHVDSAVFAYYADKLQAKYEEYLQQNNLQDVVTAYRKIKSPCRRGNKSSIDFACDVFQYIKKNLAADTPLAVVTFDIKSFFDNLDHKILKRNWKRILQVDELPDDEYNVYKNVTRYAYVDELAIFKHFKDKILCRKTGGNVVARKVANKSYLRDRNALAYCLKQNIKEIRDAKLVYSRNRKGDKDADKGIPQGLPISSVLANLYMMDFDKEADSLLKEHHGIYRRYSDDIIIVCPMQAGQELKGSIMAKIADVDLEIQEKKTNLYKFTVEGNRNVCCHETKGSNKRLEYLGFAFDGTNILLKDASVSKFYHRMYRNVRRSLYFACSIRNNTRGILFEHRLISRFTYAGAKPHLIYKRAHGSKKFRFVNGAKSYGNYLTYAHRAAETMGEDNIRRQLRRCNNKLGKAIKAGKEKIERRLSKKQILLKA